MKYKYTYKTPEGFSDILMQSDGEALTALVFEGSRDIKKFSGGAKEGLIPIFGETVKWLDEYFSGKNPPVDKDILRPEGSEFRQSVWNILLEIPYGATTTYGEIAKKLAREKGVKSMSRQAVGGRVGHNPISIIIPCHRVVGRNGSLTGYAGGIDKKISLLQHENADMSKLYRPAKSTAP